MKRKEAYLRFLAVFMIALIISLPLSIPNVSASVVVVSKHGKDNIDGILAPEDKINVTVRVTSSEEVTNDYVNFLEDGSSSLWPFTSCESEGGAFLCNYLSPMEYRLPGRHDYCVCEEPVCPETVLECPEQSQYSRDIVLKVDGKGPTITSMSIDKALVSDDNPKINFQVTDTVGGTTSGCSGIKSVKVYINGDISGEIEVKTPACTFSQKEDYEIVASELPIGENIVCVVGEDMVGNIREDYSGQLLDKYQEHCLSFIKDDRVPQFDSARLFDPSGNTELAIVGEGSTNALFVAELTLPGVELKGNSISAYLTSIGAGKITVNCVESLPSGETCYDSDAGFNPEIKGKAKSVDEDTNEFKVLEDICVDDKNLKEAICKDNQASYDHEDNTYECEGACISGSCVAEGGIPQSTVEGPFHYRCEAPVTVNLDEGGTKKINLSAEDIIGNKANMEFPISLEIDDSRPIIYGLMTDYSYYDTYFLGPENNTVFITLEDSGSGVTNQSMTVDAPGQYDSFKCGSHELYGTGCTIGGYDPPSNVGQVTFNIGGTDLAGNPVDTSQLFGANTIELDSEKPEYFNATVIATGPMVVEGESVIISARVKDNLGFDINGRNVEAAFNFVPESFDTYIEADTCMPVMPEENETEAEEPPPWEDTGWEPGGETEEGQETEIPEDMEWDCQWLINGVVNKGPNVPMISRFKIGDLVGNDIPGIEADEFAFEYTDENGRTVRKPEASIEVNGYDPTIEGSWKVDVGMGQPHADVEGEEMAIIDGQLIQVTKHRSYFPLTIEPKEAMPPGTKAASVLFKGCYGEDFEMYGDMEETIIKSISDTNMIDHEFRLVLLPAKFDDYEILEFTCAVGVVSKRGDMVSSELIVPFNVSLVVNPMDSASTKLKNRIKKLYNSWVSSPFFNFLLEDLTKVIDVMGQVCSLLKAITIVNEILYGLDQTLGVAFENKAFLDPISRGLNAANGALEKVWTVIDYVASPLCSFVMCSDWQMSGSYSAVRKCEEEGDKLDQKGLINKKSKTYNWKDKSQSEIDSIIDKEQEEENPDWVTFPDGTSYEYNEDIQDYRDCSDKYSMYPNEGAGYEGWESDWEEEGDVEPTAEYDGPNPDTPGKWGGKLPICDYVMASMKVGVGESEALQAAGLSSSLNAFPNDVRQSLLLSSLCLCIPGILANLKRIRNMQCRFISCLYQDTTQTTQLHMCEEMVHYSRCYYVWGQIFQVIPFAESFRMIIKTITEFLQSPGAWVLGAGAYACSTIQGSSTVTTICQAWNMVNKVMSTVEYFKQMSEGDYWGPEIPDECGPIRKALNKDPNFFGDKPEAEGGFEEETSAEDPDYPGSSSADDAGGE